MRQPFLNFLRLIYIQRGYLLEKIMTKFITRNEEIILLAILKLKGNAYGVSIRHQIYLDTGDKWSFASIYQPLDNLVQKKYIRRIKGDPTSRRGGKSKFYYKVTPVGKLNLQKIKKAHEQVWSGIQDISLENGN
jgi:PadR family transcriptional regulator PadR